MINNCFVVNPITGNVNVTGDAVPFSSLDVDTPAADTEAVISYTAVPGESHVISGVAWSYSAAPTGGNLIIEDGADIVFSIDITAAGPGFIPFSPPRSGTANTALVVTLAAGGGTVVGKVDALAHYTI